MNARVLAKVITEPNPFHNLEDVLAFFKQVREASKPAPDPRFDPRHREYIGK